MVNSRWVSSVGLASMLTLLGACSQDEGPVAATADDAALTQQEVTKLTDPLLEGVRTSFESAIKGEQTEFYGHASGFKWGTDAKIGATLSGEQLDFLASELLGEKHHGAIDPLPYSADFHAAKLSKTDAVAEPELRIAASYAAGVDKAIQAATKAGRTVARYEPKAQVSGVRTAGAVILVDMANREALVLYGRRGPAPLHVDCTVTKMFSYEFEESLSKEEYPDVSAYEIPITGDITLEIGGNGPLSNNDAVADDRKYTVVVNRSGNKLEVVAQGEFFEGKLVVDGATGTIYGDRDGNNRPNKAASLACK